MDDLSKFVPGVAETADPETPNVEGLEAPKKRGRKKAEGDATPKPPKEPKPKRDNIAEVKGLNSIQGVRRKLQIAIAKKAKSNGKPEAEARYQTEIDACRAKLDELMSQTSGLSGSALIAKLAELDEDPNRVITHYVGAKEKEFESFVEASGAKVPKPLLKATPDTVPASFFEDLGPDYETALNERYTKSDFRFKAVCTKYNFVAAVNAGTYIISNGKFVDPTQVKEDSEPASAE